MLEWRLVQCTHSVDTYWQNIILFEKHCPEKVFERFEENGLINSQSTNQNKQILTSP